MIFYDISRVGAVPPIISQREPFAWRNNRDGRPPPKKAKSQAAIEAHPNHRAGIRNHVVTIRAQDAQTKEIFEASLSALRKAGAARGKMDVHTARAVALGPRPGAAQIFRRPGGGGPERSGRKARFHREVNDGRSISRSSSITGIPRTWKPLGSTRPRRKPLGISDQRCRARKEVSTLLLTRLFRNGMPGAASPRRSLCCWLKARRVGSKEIYEFGEEEDRIRVAVDATDAREGHMKILNTPELSELAGNAHRRNWEAIHVTGVDTHQAGWLLEGFYENFRERIRALEGASQFLRRVCDGMILRERREIECRSVTTVSPGRWSAPDAPPRMVTLNLYYSGARIARELVSRGRACRAWVSRRDRGRAGGTFLPGILLGLVSPGFRTTPFPMRSFETWKKMGDRGCMERLSRSGWAGAYSRKSPGSLPKSERRNRKAANETESREDKLEQCRLASRSIR